MENIKLIFVDQIEHVALRTGKRKFNEYHEFPLVVISI
jgi:hypothetical protein